MTTPTKMPLNRSFTLPTTIASTSTNAPNVEIGATEGVETLFIHSNAKVVKFTTTANSRPGSRLSTSSPSQQLNSGSLPWTSSTESTIAAGPLQIYRVPGSVSFLHSGPLLHAILPRSNCWCVDGVSKFAVRVLPDTYYRIELPEDSPEDLQKVEEFKATLRNVLFYERTPCPFERGFSVDLPDEPAVRKKRRKAHGPAKKWKLDRANSWRPEDGEPPLSEDGYSSGSTSDEDSSVRTSSGEKDRVKVTELAKDVSRMAFDSRSSRPSVKDRIRGLTAASRSFTAPPQISHNQAHLSKLRTSMAVGGAVDDVDLRSAALTDEAASKRSLQAIPTDMPPSPPDSSAGYEMPEPASEPEQELESSVIVREISDEDDSAINEPGTEVDRGDIDIDGIEDYAPNDSVQEMVRNASDEPGSHTTPKRTSSPDQAHVGADEHDLQELSAASGVSSSDPFAQIQARIQARRSIGGTTSFHPSIPSQMQWSTTSTSSSSTGSGSSTRSSVSRLAQPHQQALATALVKKACSVFLGPPAHLVALMLRIAKRFANGAFGEVFSWESPARSGRRKVPGSFDLDGSDVEDFSDLEDWEGEDDFGVPLRSPIRLAAVKKQQASSRTASTGSEAGLRPRSGWDVD